MTNQERHLTEKYSWNTASKLFGKLATNNTTYTPRFDMDPAEPFFEVGEEEPNVTFNFVRRYFRVTALTLRKYKPNEFEDWLSTPINLAMGAILGIDPYTGGKIENRSDFLVRNHPHLTERGHEALKDLYSGYMNYPKFKNILQK